MRKALGLCRRTAAVSHRLLRPARVYLRARGRGAGSARSSGSAPGSATLRAAHARRARARGAGGLSAALGAAGRPGERGAAAGTAAWPLLQARAAGRLSESAVPGEHTAAAAGSGKAPSRKWRWGVSTSPQTRSHGLPRRRWETASSPALPALPAHRSRRARLSGADKGTAAARPVRAALPVRPGRLGAFCCCFCNANRSYSLVLTLLV